MHLHLHLHWTAYSASQPRSPTGQEILAQRSLSQHSQTPQASGQLVVTQWCTSLDLQTRLGLLWFRADQYWPRNQSQARRTAIHLPSLFLDTTRHDTPSSSPLFLNPQTSEPCRGRRVVSTPTTQSPSDLSPSTPSLPGRFVLPVS